MSFHPPRMRGLALGLGLLAALVVLDLALLAGVRANPLSLTGFGLGLLVLATLPVLVTLAYRTYSLARARYVVSRNALVIIWGPRRMVVPLPLIRSARPGAEAPNPAQLRPRGLAWPGSVLGSAEVPELGPVEFIAATGPEGLVLVEVTSPGTAPLAPEPATDAPAEAQLEARAGPATGAVAVEAPLERGSMPEAAEAVDTSWLAISPASPAAFLAALAEAQAQGPAEAVAPEVSLPAFELWDLWRDRLALALIGLGALGGLALIGYLGLVAPQLPPQLALHFDAQGQPDRFGPPAGLLVLPAIAALAWLANTLVGAWLHSRPRERPMSYTLFAASLLVLAFVWVATLSLLTAG